MKASSKWTLIALALMLGASTSMAALISPVNYDFGTDPGKITFGTAGFTYAASTNLATVTDLADGVKLANELGAPRANVGIFKQFTGLGGVEVNDFTITADITMADLAANSNNQRPAGIHMFATAADANGLKLSGIVARIQQTSTVGSDQLSISTGQEGGSLTTVNWIGGDVVQGETYRFTVSGAYVSADLNLSFTFSKLDGSQSQTIDYKAVAASYTGTYFGLSARINQDEFVVADNFSVIPEPSTFSMVAFMGGALFFIRRRIRISKRID